MRLLHVTACTKIPYMATDMNKLLHSKSSSSSKGIFGLAVLVLFRNVQRNSLRMEIQSWKNKNKKTGSDAIALLIVPSSHFSPPLIRCWVAIEECVRAFWAEHISDANKWLSLIGSRH